MRKESLLPVMMALITVIGCSRSPFDERKDSPGTVRPDPPAFAANADVTEFLQGRWGVNVSPDGPEPTWSTNVYFFQADGTFWFRDYANKSVLTGSYRLDNGVVCLTYEKMDGEDWNEAQAKVATEQSSGTNKAVIDGLNMDKLAGILRTRAALIARPGDTQLSFVDPLNGYVPTSEVLTRMDDPAEGK